MERRAPPYGCLRIGFLRRSRVQIRTSLFDAQLELPHPTDPVGFGLGLGFTMGPL